MSGAYGFTVRHVDNPAINVQCPICGKYTYGDNIRVRMGSDVTYLHRQCAESLKNGLDRVTSGKNSRWTNDD